MLLALNYTGVLTENFFLEGQYSKRELHVRATRAAPAATTGSTEPMIYVSGYGQRRRSHLLRRVRRRRARQRELPGQGAPASSDGCGTHDLVFGVDSYNDKRLSNNYQTPSNFRVYIYDGPAYGPTAPSTRCSATTARSTIWPIFDPQPGHQLHDQLRSLPTTPGASAQGGPSTSVFATTRTTARTATVRRSPTTPASARASACPGTSKVTATGSSTPASGAT